MKNSNLFKKTKKSKIKILLAKMLRMHASDAAEIFCTLPEKTQLTIFRLFPKKFAAKVFTYLKISDKDQLIGILTKKEIKRLLLDLNPDDLTDLIEESPRKLSKKIFKFLSARKLKEVEKITSYPIDSVGREMTHQYISVQSNWSVKKSMDHIRKYGQDKETINIVYIVDKNGKFLGDIKLKYLIFADEKQKIGDIAKKTIDTTAISVFDDKEKAVQLIKKLNVTALPVVDDSHNLLGIVTVDDLIDIEEEEVTEDFQKMGAVSVGHGGDLSLTNLVDASAKLLYKKRIGWLLVLVFMNIFAGGAISLFEDVISSTIALLFFLPLLIGSGGNAGSQAAMLMVRALGTGDVKMTDWFKLFIKEISVALALGITMAIGVSIIGWFRGGIDIAIIVSLAMVSIVIVGSLFGMLLPFVFTKFNKDPATASGPLITCVADVLGVLIYFSIAKWYFAF